MNNTGPKITKERLEKYQEFLTYLSKTFEKSTLQSDFQHITRKFKIDAFAQRALISLKFLGANNKHYKWLMGEPTKIMTRAFMENMYKLRHNRYFKTDLEIQFPETPKSEEVEFIPKIDYPKLKKERKSKQLKTFSLFWGLIKFNY